MMHSFSVLRENPGWGKDLSKMVLDEYTMMKHVYVDLTGEKVKPWYMLLK